MKSKRYKKLPEKTNELPAAKIIAGSARSMGIEVKE